MPGLEVVADSDISVDERALAEHGVLADPGRSALRVVTKSDGDVRLNAATSADDGVVEACLFVKWGQMLSVHDHLLSLRGHDLFPRDQSHSRVGPYAVAIFRGCSLLAF